MSRKKLACQLRLTTSEADSQIDMLGNAAGGICLLLLIFAFVIDLFTRPFYAAWTKRMRPPMPNTSI